MKEIRLSIKEHRLTDKYLPKFKQYDYVKSFDFENDDDIELIYEIINLYVHTYYQYNENNRKEKEFRSASAIFLDFDSKNGHNDSKISEFINSDFAKKYNWMLYTSKSHISGVQDCYHVVLPLDTQIIDIPTLNATYTSVFSDLISCGLICDTVVRDGARLIFPSLNESKKDDDYHFNNFIFDIHKNGEYLKPSSIPVIEISDVISDESITYDDYCDNDELSEYVTEFNNMSLKAKYSYFKTMVKFINGYNRRFNYSYLTYNRWIAIGYTLYKIFGKVKGKKLFRHLSYGYPGDTRDSIDAQFDYLCGCVFNTNTNVEILIQLTGAIGFKHTMYFRYYFMSKHRFNISQTSVLYDRMVKVLLQEHGYIGIPKDVKIYDFSFKRNTRTFLMELNCEDGIRHITVTLSHMMDVMADILNIPRKFITTAITHGVIRRIININGVYDITRYIKTKIITLLQQSDNEYIRVDDVHRILRKIRDYAPSTIYSLLTNKNIELYFFELGIFINKKKKRFVIDGVSAPYFGYKVDRSKIIISDNVSVPKRRYYYKHIEPRKQLSSNIQNVGNMVMRC